MLRRFLADERGLELPEYAVMTALIIVAMIAAIITLGGAIANRFRSTANTIGNTPNY